MPALHSQPPAAARPRARRRPTTAPAVRLLRLAGGWTLMLVGVVMIPLPGPGLVVVFAGLAVLGREQTWARSTLVRLRRARRRRRAATAARSPRAPRRHAPGTAGSAPPCP